MSSCVETRFAYGEALLELGTQRSDVVVLDADLYRSTRTVLFRDAFPDRFIDIGISEADMVSTAAGMAASGLIPYCNSFAMFVPGLCYIPIRTQIAYPALPVKLIGSSSGLTQGPDGASHQSLEDISLMRSLPNMIVVSPADDVETRQATFALADWPGPAYMRLGRYPVPRLNDDNYRFAIGKSARLRVGDEVVIFATGHMVSKALAASELLAHEGVDAGVINVSTIKPLDEAAIREAAAKAALVVTAEEHSIIGGLGSAVAECLAEIRPAAPLLRLGVRDCFGESGLADELLEKHGLQPTRICASIVQRLRTIKSLS
ncbi:transketolase family protein [Candidatus Sumerlaeota bacterium]|nr:transketolase family protein [Candidatus Sumerlaeota bacterium]